MKYFFYLLIVLGSVSLVRSQTRIEKSIGVNFGQKVEMHFQHPKLITIKTWDKNEIKIVANVSINYGFNDEAFEIEYEDGETVHINSLVKNFDDLPQKVVIKYQDEEYFFDTSDMRSPEVMKFRKEMGVNGFEYLKHGVIMDIQLELMVPRGISLKITAKYGMVEVLDFTNNMDIHSRFGGIDVSVDSEENVSMSVKTKFGEVYSNLDMKFSSRDDYQIGRWTTLEGKTNKGGSTQSLKSEFGNVYLRKL